MKITPRQYVEYIETVAALIGAKKDYITELDAATGDGDHWLNLNIGYEKLLASTAQLREEPDFSALFMKLARLIMSGMGGTSGALYGSMYLASAKKLGAAPELDGRQIAEMLACWAESIMLRGNTKPGYKTMLDAVLPASEAFSEALAFGEADEAALDKMKRAAWDGAERTAQMEAVRGRASNQPEKGVGHLDPGAVTMAMQLEALAEYLKANCL